MVALCPPQPCCLRTGPYPDTLGRLPTVLPPPRPRRQPPLPILRHLALLPTPPLTSDRPLLVLRPPQPSGSAAAEPHPGRRGAGGSVQWLSDCTSPTALVVPPLPCPAVLRAPPSPRRCALSLRAVRALSAGPPHPHPVHCVAETQLEDRWPAHEERVRSQFAAEADVVQYPQSEMEEERGCGDGVFSQDDRCCPHLVVLNDLCSWPAPQLPADCPAAVLSAARWSSFVLPPITLLCTGSSGLNRPCVPSCPSWPHGTSVSPTSSQHSVTECCVDPEICCLCWVSNSRTRGELSARL